jgi:hypothetical protein
MIKKTIKLKGDYKSGKVWMDGKELQLEKSLRIKNHSPSGFSWGYCGSGPSQLSLAICIELYTVGRAMQIYQKFKEDVISRLPETDFDQTINIKYYS